MSYREESGPSPGPVASLLTIPRLTMSYSLFIFACAFFTVTAHPSFAQAEAPSPESTASPCVQETDEFKQQTVTRCDPLSVEIEQEPDESLYRTRVLLSEIDGQAFLLVYTVSESWNFLDVDTAYALIDGDSYEFPFADVEREVESGRVTEQNAVMLDDDVLDALASATEVRVKVGSGVLRLPAEDLGAHVRALRQE